jgi:hypothetical protein
MFWICYDVCGIILKDEIKLIEEGKWALICSSPTPVSAGVSIN